MGDATRDCPPFPPGFHHSSSRLQSQAPLCENSLICSISSCLPAPPWCYNPISRAGRYLNSPSQDWRPGFSLVDYPAGCPGPMGVGLCRFHAFSELRLVRAFSDQTSIVRASLQVFQGNLSLYTHTFSDSYYIVVCSYGDLLPLFDQQVG